MFVIIIVYDDCSDDHAPSASGLFADCGIPNWKAVVRSLIYKFITRLNESSYDVILAILSSDIRWTSRIRRYWAKTLYVHCRLVRVTIMPNSRSCHVHL